MCLNEELGRRAVKGKVQAISETRCVLGDRVRVWGRGLGHLHP